MFVLDASVVASWCFADESHPSAQLAFALIEQESAVAPTLLWFEVRNVLLVGERRKRLSEAQVGLFLTHLSELPIEVDHAPDERTVLGLARRHNLSVYDAVYLELAQRRALALATLDRALMNVARAEKVALLGEG